MTSSENTFKKRCSYYKKILFKKNASISSNGNVGDLLFKRCEFIYGKSWYSRTDFNYGDYSSPLVEETNANFNCRGNHFLYDADSADILIK